MSVCSDCKGFCKIKCRCDHGFLTTSSSTSGSIGLNVTGGAETGVSGSQTTIKCPICDGSEYKKCGKCDGTGLGILKLSSSDGEVETEILICLKSNRTKHILYKLGKTTRVCGKCWKGNPLEIYHCPKCFDTDYCYDCAIKEKI